MTQGAPSHMRCLGLHRFHPTNPPEPNTFAGTSGTDQALMINKIVQSMAEAIAGIRDGAVVLIGGFGSMGQPNALIEALVEQGAKDLTVVANNAGVGQSAWRG